MRQWRSVARAGTVTPMVVEPQSLDSLSAEQLRELTARLMVQVRHQSALLEKLTHENALLKRMKFAAQSERFNPEQKSLLEDEIEADLAAVASEIDALTQTQAPATPIRNKPNGYRCRRTCRAARFATNLRPPPAPVAAR